MPPSRISPFAPHPILLPLLLAMAGAALSTLLVHLVLWAIDNRRRKRRMRAGRCSNCGYNLLGNVSGICPECGANFVGGPSA